MTAAEAWADGALASPLLRDLGADSRRSLLAAARLRKLDDGQALYRAGESGDCLFLVVEGRLSVRATRRGDDADSELRTAARGDTVGEEALLPGLSRRATATALGSAHVAEIPISVFRRLIGRASADAGEYAERERRMVARASARDLIATHALTRDLPTVERDAVLDAARFAYIERGDRVFSTGDPANDCFLIVDGLIQLQSDDDAHLSPHSNPHPSGGGAAIGSRETTRALAYLVGGDILGHEQLHPGERRTLTAVAIGPTHVLRVPIAVIRELSDRNPGLLARVSRIAAVRERGQERALRAAREHTTRHVFRDLYRMQMARSLLVIDQDQCVRCGHCAWSCASVHGTSRLLRRGDKLIARVRQPAGPSADAPDDPHESGAPSSLLIPNSCQHCRHAACMIDCPTGAIGRDPHGEVFIRPDLCTGCGHCAKQCPWENIRMAPRALANESRPELSDELAVKCDLCREYQAPACVQSCPTGALVRLDPGRDIAELGQFLGTADPSTPDGRAGADQRRARSVVAIWSLVQLWALAVAVAGVPWALAMHASGAWRPDAGAGLLAGWLAGLMMVALGGYALIKRATRRWMKRRERASAARRLVRIADPTERAQAANAARSRIRPYYLSHVALGLVSIAIVCAHAGASMPASPAGAAMAGFWLVALLGLVGELCYRTLPVRLSRLERRGALPEDLPGERAALLSRLYRQSSGAEAAIKQLLADVVIPYARSARGSLALFVSGRGLAAEEERLRGLLRAEQRARFPGMRPRDTDELVRIAVEIRALPIRRACTFALRAWLPVHILASAVFGACLLLHVVTVLLGG